MDSDSTSSAASPLKDDSRKDSRVQLCHIKGRLTAPVRCPCYPGLKRFISDRREEKSARAGGTEETARARTHSLTHTHCWKSAAHEYTLPLARALSALHLYLCAGSTQKICEHHWPIIYLFTTHTHRSTHKCRASVAYSRTVVHWFTLRPLSCKYTSLMPSAANLHFLRYLPGEHHPSALEGHDWS